MRTVLVASVLVAMGCARAESEPAALDGSKTAEPTGSADGLVGLAQRLEAGETPSDADWRSALLGSVLRYRTEWAADRDLVVQTDPPRGLGRVEIRFTPRDSGLAAFSAGEHVPRSGLASLPASSRRSHVVGRLAAGRRRLVLDVEVERRADDDFDPRFDEFREPLRPELLWRGEVELALDVRPTTDEVVPPVRGAAVDAAVRGALSAERRPLPAPHGLPRPEGVEVRLAQDLPGEWPRTAFSLRVTLREGRLAFESGLMRPGGRLALSTPPARLDEGGRWNLLVEGTAEGVLETLDAEERYAGELVVPLSDLLAGR